MDSSPGSPYGSSPEPPPRRGGGPRARSPGPEDKERSTYVRLLVSNSAAGCIIGKGGSTITEFQSQSGTRIQLSRNNEFFPGTSDRIIMISGAFDEIIKAMELIHEKLLNDAEDSIEVPSQRKDSNDTDNRSKMRLVVPNACCGCIIGKGGATIKSFIDDSQAGIKISPQDQRCIGLNDRIVTLTGSLQQQIRAFVLILSKLTEDPHYAHTVNTPFPYAGVSLSSMHGVPVGYMIPPVAYNTMNYGSNGVGGKLPIIKGRQPVPLVKSAMIEEYQAPVPHHSRRSNGGSQEGHVNSVTIGVADEHIGAVVGRGGRNIMEISQTSGARIKISDRGDFMTGTSDRKVTITGSNEAIRAAEDMIMRRISSNYDSP